MRLLTEGNLASDLIVARQLARAPDRIIVSRHLEFAAYRICSPQFNAATGERSEPPIPMPVETDVYLAQGVWVLADAAGAIPGTGSEVGPDMSAVRALTAADWRRAYEMMLTHEAYGVQDATIVAAFAAAAGITAAGITAESKP